MARVVGVLIAACLWCAAAFAQTMTPQAFTERLAEAMRAAVPSASVTVNGELRLFIKRADGSSADVNLSNVYGEYRGQPARYGDLVEIFVRALKEPVPPKLERANIVPMIKDRAWLDEIAPIFRSRGTEPLVEPFNEELLIAYVEDSQARARYLNSREDIGDRKSLRTLAIDNLRRLLPKIEMRQYGDSLAILSAGGNYEASLLQFEEIWTGGQIKFEGDIVVAVPARDTLLVSGLESQRGLSVMREMVKKVATGPYRLTDALFVYRQGRFVKFSRD